MSKSWGTPTWFYFHSLAEQIDEIFYMENHKTIFNYIKSICSCLPCPDCTNHATTYLSKINVNNLRRKIDLKYMLIDFHNNVNIRKNKPIFKNYDMYKLSRIEPIYTEFRSQYLNNKIQNRGFNQTLQRKKIIEDLDKFMTNNINKFKHFK
jgi:hypothetical protein